MKQFFLIIAILFSSAYAGFDFGECSGSGTFKQQIVYFNGDLEKTATVGVIPKGIKGLKVELNSDEDVDIRLYGANNDKIVHWPYGILSGPSLETKPYKGIPVTYSGYNGSNGEKGHEFIEVKGTTPTEMTMKAFGYKAGFATVNYSWTAKEGCNSSPKGTGHFEQPILNKAISLVGTIPPHIKNLKIYLTSDKDIDIQLYGADGTAIVAWDPKGLISGPNKQTVNYHKMHIEWSGYNGTNGNKGNEYIIINGDTTETLTMKVYGYQAGSANVDYSWGEDDTPADITPPVIKLNGGNITLNAGDSYNELGAKATDNIDGDISSKIIISGNVNTSVPGTYTINYSVSDKAGNKATATRKVTVKQPADTTPPVIKLNGGNITLNIGDSYHELGAKATDNVDGDISSKIVISGNVNTSVAGTYTIKYSVSDKAGNNATATRKVIVRKKVTTITKTLELRVASGKDDVEEHSDGHISVSSSDLEMTQEHDKQHVAIRYCNITIPQGAVITNAYLQFQTDETSSTTTHLFITTQDSSNAPAFVDKKYNITSRATLSSEISWNPPAWSKVGEQSLKQRTPNLSSIIQPLINKSSWHKGNAIAFIISGDGKRVAESYDGDSPAAPLLHIDYKIQTDSSKIPPVITLKGASQVTIEVGSNYIDSGATAKDEKDGDISKNIIVHNPVNTSIIGNYTITYNVVDSDGNSANEVKRYVHVVATSAKPLFTKAPYLLYPGVNTQMLLVWQLEKSYSTTVYWGKDTSYSDGQKTLNEYSSSHQYKMLFNNLSPNTKYYYKVEVNSKNIYTGSFKTGETNANTKLSFYVYGDTRSQPDKHDLVAKKIMEYVANDPKSQSFIISSGDLVSNGEDEATWQSQFFDPKYSNLQNMLRNLPYLAVVGNHAGNGKLFGKYFPYPMYASNRYYYSFDYGPVHFTIIDQFTDYSKGSKQYNWIKNDLENSNKTWKVLLLHMPGWSAGGHSNNSDVQNLIQPLCVSNNVQMVIAGHNHYYARAVVDGVQHITSGGGGAPLYDPHSNAQHIVKIDKSYHFLKIDINGNTMHISAIRADGSIIETFNINSN